MCHLVGGKVMRHKKKTPTTRCKGRSSPVDPSQDLLMLGIDRGLSAAVPGVSKELGKAWNQERWVFLRRTGGSVVKNGHYGPVDDVTLPFPDDPNNIFFSTRLGLGRDHLCCGYSRGVSGRSLSELVRESGGCKEKQTRLVRYLVT